MRQPAKPTDRHRSRTQHASAGDEPARFLRNLTSLPDAEFASTYSPAIHAVLARYAHLPNPAAARRELLLALKAALKRRRAFILPRFTQAEDSWRIRECATYAVAIAILVEHAAAILAPDRAEQPTDPDAWTRILADPEADPDAGSRNPHQLLFHAIVPARGRHWLAREPLVRTLIANYFTDTAPNELQDIVGSVVSGFGHQRQPAPAPGNQHSPPDCPARVQDCPPKPPTPNRPPLIERTLSWVRAAFRHHRRTRIASEGSRTLELDLTDTTVARRHPPHHDATSPESTSTALSADADRMSSRESATDTTKVSGPPPSPNAPSPPSPTPPPNIQTRTPRTSNPLRQRRSGARVADLLHGLPTAPTSTWGGTLAETLTPLTARRRDIGDHDAAAPRIGHAADYARSLMATNGLPPMLQGESLVLPGLAPKATRQPLDITALFPAKADPTRVDADAIAAWIAFRDHLVDALRSGAQSANSERSLVHLLDIGVFLVWPHIVLHFDDELRLTPQAIKAAMRTAGVLAVNHADRQDDPYTFPALTGDPTVTCRGLVTLPEYLWPDASHRPIAASTFVSPPAIYGQRYRRPH